MAGVLAGVPAVAAAGVAKNTSFQPATAVMALGYTADGGAAYSDTRGSGWVREDSLKKPTHVPLDVSANAVERGLYFDQRLDTFIQMQFATGATSLPGAAAAAWEMAVPSGLYEVVVSVGDPGPDRKSSHRINIEGQNALAGFVPTSKRRFATRTKTVRVSDGRLTIDAIGGTNTKINFVQVTGIGPSDSTAPAAPRGVRAAPGNGMVTLDWKANRESDLGGYDVYRSTSRPVRATGAPLNGATPLTTTTFTDMRAPNGRKAYYAVVASDTSGNRTSPSPTVSAAPSTRALAAAAATSLAINFQPASAAVPAGYTADSGAAYSAATGQGWVREDSVGSASPVPLSITANGRDRNINADQRLDTFIHMQYPTSATGAGVKIPAAWELAVPDGDYTVLVSVGDAGPTLDSTNQINVEGQAAIAGFVPTSATHFASATRTVHVSDGRLTIDAIGGTNTKIDYIDITSAADTTPPAPPTNVAATPGNGQVALTWNANAEPDIAGYDVFRGTSQPVSTAGTPLNGATPLTGTSYTDTTPVNGTTYHYVVVARDTSSNASPPSSAVTATPQPAPPAVDRAINFQPAASAVPTGYTADTGAAYSTATGQGWVREDSLGGTHVGLDVSANTRERNVNADQRLDTFLHMQYPTSATGAGVKIPAAWELAVPSGAYTVTVAVGDAGPAIDSTHRIRAEGQVVIAGFVPNATTKFATDTQTVNVTDGRLTIDAIGGTNTKIDYVNVTSAGDASPPAAPSNVVATPGDGQVGLTWNANTEPDLVGYDVFRSTTLPVSTAGTPLNGSTPLTNSNYTDATAFNGTTYHYVVVARDTSGNVSGPSSAVTATPQAAPPAVNKSINFQPAGAAIPAGYTADTGAAYSTAAGQGWIRQDSLDTTHVGLDVSANSRDRNINADQRLDTFIHMQYPTEATGTGVKIPAAWELSVPSGGYTVTVAVGDAGPALDSSNRINIEGQVAISGFVPTAGNKFFTSTRTVNVSDGRLTIDALGGTNTKIDYITVVSDSAAQRPSVTSVSPANGATGTFRDAPVTAEVNLPNVGAGIDPATLNSSTVRLVRNSDGVEVPANRNTTGAGDAIILQPTDLLAASTNYRVEITSGLRDISGAPFLPFDSSFTTGTATSGGGGTINAEFTQVALPSAQGQSFTSMIMGPDNKLYAATIDGNIYRFVVNADGTLGTPQVISSVQTANGGPRTILGLAFDPASTASNLILWITHNEFAFDNATDWTGKVSRLSGSDLQTVQDYVVGLPRSIRDHETNGVAFGPDGALYVTQGSESANGAPDNGWGLRTEHVLNAAVLRVDTSAISSPPVDVKSEAGGTYNPFAPGAPVTVYASGLRNAFDLVWHTNGELYAPTNGSAAGGSAPATPATLPSACANRRMDLATNGAYTGPSVPGLSSIGSAQNDYLNRVVQGGYYGHPNPQRCEWVVNGGNPTSGTDTNQLPQYPVGVQPDRNYRGAAYDFGAHFSPDGAIEYRNGAFGGALRGKLLVVRYSAGDDVIALTPNTTNHNIQDAQTGIPGLTGFVDPLDITEDRRNGNLYVSELGANRITLLRVVDSGTTAPTMTTSPPRLVFNDVQGGAASASKDVTIRNDGNAPLSVSSLAIGGTNANQFALSTPPSLPATIAPGATLTVPVVFNPTSTGPKTATLTVSGNDSSNASDTIELRGLGTLGQGGANEPSLQWILDTFDIPVNAGDPDPTNSSLPTTPIIGDEVPLQKLVKAGTGSVTLEPLAVFGPQSSGGEVTNLGWYPTAGGARTQLFSAPNASFQSLEPPVTGSLSFDPGTTSFGLSTIWPFFSNRQVYSEDSKNTFDASVPHHFRAYPLKASNGSVVANSYVVAFEENNSGYDYQDLVFIVRNVKPAPTATGAQISLTNLDGAPFPDRLAFNRIGTLASPPPDDRVHDRSKLRISNTGTGPLTINSLTLSSASWQLVTPPALPATIPVGGQLDLTVQFIQGSAGASGSGNVFSGTLTIGSNDAVTPSQAVQLRGYWQSVPEQGQEPGLSKLVNSIFGYATTINYSGQTLNRVGRVEAAGEEVLSPYWSRTDTTKPVSVRQLNAFHTQGNTAQVFWHPFGSDAGVQLFKHDGRDAQSLFPLLNGTSSTLTAGSFTPSSSAFGFKIEAEWSDDLKNIQSVDQQKGCPGPCGHHVRFWPAEDRSGNRIPDTYLMAMDYSGINYDYNDNLYLVSNIKPAWTGPVLQRLDVGGSANFTDSNGSLWKPDTGLFTPSTAPAEGASTQPQEILNTGDDPIYRTYRGNVGNVPQAQRILSYALPTGAATKVDLRLHFAERAVTHTAAGQRLFDISVEGALLVDNFDIFARAGGQNKAFIYALNNLTVTGGVLNLVLKADVDYPSIAGIEVFCRVGC